MAAGAHQGDIAESSGGKRGDGKIQGIHVILDGRVMLNLVDIDDRGHHKDEYQQIDHAENHVFMEAHVTGLAAQAAQYMVGAQQTQGADHPHEYEVADHHRRQQGYDDDEVGQARQTEGDSEPLPADKDARGKLHEIDEADHHLDAVDFMTMVIKRCGDKISEREHIEAQQAPAKHIGTMPRSVVEVVDAAVEPSWRARWWSGVLAHSSQQN